MQARYCQPAGIYCAFFPSDDYAPFSAPHPAPYATSPATFTPARPAPAPPAPGSVLLPFC